MQVPYIPKDAPFSGDQRAWLGGFLAGLHSRAAMTGEAPEGDAPQKAELIPLDILFGTQTGNAEMVAGDAAALAKSRGYAPRMRELDEVEASELATLQNVLVITSTYGDGEMPDNAMSFWDSLSATTAPRMENVRFGVLGLGDTSYEHFCQAGKLIDTRMEQLGAIRITDRVDCDIDFEEAAAEWMELAIPAASAAIVAEPEKTTEVEAPKKSAWGRKNPYLSTMVENRLLSGEKSAKEIRHLAFDLGDSGLTYEAGDAMSVMPVNAPDLVEGLLERLGFDAGADAPGHEGSMGQVLTTGLEIMTPSRDLIREIGERAGHEELNHVLGHGDKESLDHFLWGKDILDMLNLNPDLKLDPAEFFGLLKPLQHRAYSISSSPKAHPGEVHLTVAAVRWKNDGREHKGVCSTYLADHVPAGVQAGIFMSPNKSFRVPQDDNVPMIMVGPGTGIAPFRAFLEERRERGAKGANWLFFGDQHRECDFIYEDEITAMQQSGVLNRLDLAFSRDQAEKIYVQTRMLENGKDLFGMLEDGGNFYVCGDATRMARDVDAALHELIAEHGGMSADAAADYVQNLKRDKRYVRDVY